MIRDSSCHCGRHAQALMTAAKIVKSEPYDNSGPVVFPFLAKAIRQACKATKTHPYTEVPAFHYRGADTLGIGRPKIGTTSTDATSAGLYRASPSLAAR